MNKNKKTSPIDPHALSCFHAANTEALAISSSLAASQDRGVVGLGVSYLSGITGNQRLTFFII